MVVNLRRAKTKKQPATQFLPDRAPLPAHRHPLLTEFVSVTHPYGSAGERASW